MSFPQKRTLSIERWARTRAVQPVALSLIAWRKARASQRDSPSHASAQRDAWLPKPCSRENAHQSGRLEREKGFEPSTSTLAKDFGPFSRVASRYELNDFNTRRYPDDPSVTPKWCSKWCSRAPEHHRRDSNLAREPCQALNSAWTPPDKAGRGRKRLQPSSQRFLEVPQEGLRTCSITGRETRIEGHRPPGSRRKRRAP